MNINTAINEAQTILKKKFIDSAQLDCELLMSKVINKDRKYIILNTDKDLKLSLYNRFKELVKQRSKGKPIAYLVGKKDFWKYQFLIKENVLIPRPDTEILIEQILNFSSKNSKLNLLDIGVGSGCILLSILKERKNFYGTGIDISKKSLKVSKFNAKELGLENRVKFYHSDVDNFNNGKYDVIVSNPPYIENYNLKYLDKDVKNFEPKLALNGGLEGVSQIRKVITKSSVLIKKQGKLILEIGFDQKNKVKEILKKEGFYINKILKDYAKNDRCIISTKI